MPDLQTALCILTGREMAKWFLSNHSPSYCNTSVLFSLTVRIETSCNCVVGFFFFFLNKTVLSSSQGKFVGNSVAFGAGLG